MFSKSLFWNYLKYGIESRFAVVKGDVSSPQNCRETLKKFTFEDGKKENFPPMAEFENSNFDILNYFAISETTPNTELRAFLQW